MDDIFAILGAVAGGLLTNFGGHLSPTLLPKFGGGGSGRRTFVQ